VHVSSTAINAGQPIMTPDTSNRCTANAASTTTGTGGGTNQQPGTSSASNTTLSHSKDSKDSKDPASVVVASPKSSPVQTRTNSNDLLNDGSGQILSPWRRNSLYNSFSQLVQSQKVTYEKNYRRDQIDSDSQRSQSEQSELDKVCFWCSFI
jgi:hypothetical protein